MSRTREWRRPPKDWNEFGRRAGSPKGAGVLVFWFLVWAITGFNPWVGFGLAFAAMGSLGMLGGGRKGKDEDWFDDEDDEESAAEASRRARAVAPPAADEVEPAPRSDGSAPLHRTVIEGAAGARARLEAAASVATGPLGDTLRAMLARVRDVETGLEADPSRLADVQRLFTYYLPATADLLSARGAVAASGDAARMTEIDGMIAKLDLAYTDFARRLNSHDARNLDIDLRLLDRALDEEFSHGRKG